MRTENELQKRLQDAIAARLELLAEEEKAESEHDRGASAELAEEIANLGGVITTLEWVLGSGAAPEYK